MIVSDPPLKFDDLSLTSPQDTGTATHGVVMRARDSCSLSPLWGLCTSVCRARCGAVWRRHGRRGGCGPAGRCAAGRPPGKRVRERSGTSSNQESCFGSRRRRATNYKNVERRMTARALLAFRRLSLQSESLRHSCMEEVETERGAHLSQLRTPRHRAPAPTQLCHSWPEAWLGLATACSTVSCSPCAPGTGVSFRSRIAKRVAHRRRPNAIHADGPAEGGLAARARFHLPPSSAPARFR
jgi:hypothetical protein